MSAWKIVGAGALLLALFCEATTAAERAHVEDRQVISPMLTFPKDCFDSGGEAPAIEAEPFVASEPGHPNHLIASWMQGITPKGGAMANVVARSTNGGRTWKRRIVPPGINNCTGNPEFDRNGDPWVSFGDDGTAYLVSHAGTSANDPDSQVPGSGRRAEMISTSTNGGLTWSRPTTAVSGIPGAGAVDRNDKPAIWASRFHAGEAVIAFNKMPASGLGGGEVWFSRTLDGNQTWSPQSLVYLPPGSVQAAAPIPFSHRDGSLTIVWTEFPTSSLGTAVDPSFPPGDFSFRSIYSPDGGQTWQAPVTVGEATMPVAFDYEANHTIFPAYPSVSAAKKGGILYLVWHEIDSPSSARIMIASSRDRGRTWSKPKTIEDVPAQAITPSVAVSRRGEVGVSWLDLRQERPGDAALTSRFRFAYSREGGRSWNHLWLSRRFDLRRATERTQYVIPGWFLGDYYGLAGTGRGFNAVWIETNEKSDRKATDVVAARVVLPR